MVAQTLTGSVVDANNIASINVNLISDSDVTATEFTNVAQIAITNGLGKGTGTGVLHVNDAQLATTLAVQKNRSYDVVVDSFGDVVSGTADAVNLSVTGAGTKTTTFADGDALFDVSVDDAIETVNLATSGTNYVTLDAGTAATSIKVTGSGTNTIALATAAASKLSVDLSGTTGTNTFDIGTLLNGTTTVTGGSGADTLKVNLTSATNASPTISGVETLTLDFDAAATFTASKVTGATNLNINGSAAAATVSQLAATVDTLGTTTTNAGAVKVNYVTGAAADVTYNIGSTATTATAVSNASTSFTNVDSLTINAGGNKTSDTGALSLGTATALSLTTAAAANDLTVGTVSGTKLTTIDIAATAGDVIVSTVNATADGSKLTGLTVAATGGADVTVGDVTANDGVSVSAFSTLDVAVGDESAIVIGAIVGITGTKGNTVSTYNVVMGDTIGTSSIGSVTAEEIGDINVTVGANSSGATLTIGAFDADTIGNITVEVGTNNTVSTSSDDSGGGNYAIGDITATGAGNFTFVAGNGSTADTVGTVDSTGLTGVLNIDLSNVDLGTTITDGSGAAVIVATSGADQITTGGGADAVTSGAGQDVIYLTETTSAADDLYYAHSGNYNVDVVTGFAVAADDVFAKSTSTISNNTDGTTTTNTVLTTSGVAIAATGAGSLTTVSHAVNTSVDMSSTANQVLFMSTAATSWATAVGTGVITTGVLSATQGVLTVWYDSAAAQAVVGYVLDSTATDTLTSADTFVELTRIGMASADYTLANIDGIMGTY